MVRSKADIIHHSFFPTSKYFRFSLEFKDSLRRSYHRNIIHCAPTLLYDHVGELCHLDLGVVAFFDQVHHGKRCALDHRTFSLSITIVTLGLLAPTGAPERLITCWLNDPVLGPRKGTEVNEVLLTAACTCICVGFTVATCPLKEKRRHV